MRLTTLSTQAVPSLLEKEINISIKEEEANPSRIRKSTVVLFHSVINWRCTGRHNHVGSLKVFPVFPV